MNEKAEAFQIILTNTQKESEQKDEVHKVFESTTYEKENSTYILHIVPKIDTCIENNVAEADINIVNEDKEVQKPLLFIDTFRKNVLEKVSCIDDVEVENSLEDKAKGENEENKGKKKIEALEEN